MSKKENKQLLSKKRKHQDNHNNDDDDINDDINDGIDVNDNDSHDSHPNMKEINKNDQEVNDDNNDDDNNNNSHNEEDGEEQKSKRKRKRKRKKKNDTNTTNNDNGNGGSSNKDNNGVEDKLNSLDYTVYVEGIPFDCSEDEVKTFFVDNGCEDVIEMRLPRWQDSGRLRGYGHIVFDSTTSKSKALTELNGKNLGKRYITIQEANRQGQGGNGRHIAGNPREQPNNCRTVFVKNLPYNNITEDDVLQVFRSCGKIVDGGVRLARNYQTKQLKGFGYIEYKNPEGAYSAVQRASKTDGIKVGGRICYVDYDESTMKGSFRTAEGKLWQKKHGSVHNNNNNNFQRNRR